MIDSTGSGREYSLPPKATSVKGNLVFLRRVTGQYGGGRAAFVGRVCVALGDTATETWETNRPAGLSKYGKKYRPICTKHTSILTRAGIYSL